MEDHPIADRPNIGLAYEIAVYDKDGNLKEHREEEAKCLVANFLKMLRSYYILGVPSGYATAHTMETTPVVDITGVVKNVAPDTYSKWAPAILPGGFRAMGGEGNDLFGIVIGSGDVAVALSDYALQSKISNGSGPGQLAYGAVTIPDVSETGNEMVMRIRRFFENRGSESVEFSEIGLYHEYTHPATGYVMSMRDVLPQPVSLAPGEGCVVVYKIIFN